MASSKFVFYLTCLFLGKMAQETDRKLASTVHQERRFISANVGDKVTLQCFYEGDLVVRFYWYKQTFGQKPRLMAISYTYDKNEIFYNEFKNDPRFSLDTENDKNSLKISDLVTSDSANYYCAIREAIIFEFVERFTVSVTGPGLNSQALVHQSVSETFQPGGSVTLNCTVHTGTCAGELSVHWFKYSEESHPGLIYTHGDRKDQCERKPNTQTHTCGYNLPVANLNLSHAGTYYCAVASCGHILFGNGTKLDTEDEEDSFVLRYFLSSALVFTTILCFLLAFLLIRKSNNCKPTEPHARVSAPSTTNSQSCKTEENLQYAALRVKSSDGSRRQRDNTEVECVYSTVKK